MTTSLPYNGRIPTDPFQKVIALISLGAALQHLTPDQLQTLAGIVELLALFRR